MDRLRIELFCEADDLLGREGVFSHFVDFADLEVLPE